MIKGSKDTNTEVRSERWRPNWLMVGLVIAVVIALSLLAYLLSRKQVTVLSDGRSRTLTTHQADVAGLLNDAGIELLPGDEVSPFPETLLQDGIQVKVERAKTVSVEVDGKLMTRRTTATSAGELLTELGIELQSGDRVLDGDVQIWPLIEGESAESTRLPEYILVQRALSLLVNDGGERLVINTSEATVGQALEAAGIVIYLGDDVEPPLDTDVFDGLEVVIRRSVPVTIEIDDRSIHTRTHSQTIKDLVSELGIVLVGGDYTLPGVNDSVEPDMIIRVVRVLEEIVTEQEPIPYETVWQPDSALEIDLQRVAQEGAPGVLQRRIRVRYENRQEVSRVLEDEWVVLEPTTHVIAYGTKLVFRQLETPEGSIEYWRKLRVLVTSYTSATSGKERDHPAYGITAVGWEMRHGIIAVDPRVINLYQEIFVPGYGIGVAADTGGAIKGRRIDLGYEEAELVLWYDWVDIYLLTPPPDPNDIHYIIGD